MGLFDALRLNRREQPVERPEIGASGTVNLNGWLVSHEYNSNLAGARGLATWNEMHRSDGSVRETLWHIWAPILNAHWDMEPPEEPDEDELFATELARQAFFHLPKQPFSEHLGQALKYLRDGVQLFEPAWWIVDDVELKIELPRQPGEAETAESTRTRTLSQVLTWRRFAPRLPATISEWNVDQGELESVVQSVFKDGNWGQEEIPGEDLIVFVNEREGDDFWGLSLLRSAYKAWFYKDLFEKISAKSYETHGVGLNVAYLPAGTTNDSEVVSTVEGMLARIRAGEDTNLVFPGPKAQAAAQAGDGYFFEIVTPEGELPDFKSMLEYFRGEIKGNALVRFAELGHGQTGARSTGDTQAEVWTDALHAVAKHIADCHAAIIERLIRSNLTNVKRMPKLVAQDIESKNLTEFAEAVSKLVQSGAAEPDRPFRAAVREAMDMPPEEDPDAIDEQRAAPPPLADPYPDDDEEEKPKPETPPARAADIILAHRLDRMEDLLARPAPAPAPAAPHVEVHPPNITLPDLPDLAPIVASQQALLEEMRAERRDMLAAVGGLTSESLEAAERSEKGLAALVRAVGEFIKTPAQVTIEQPTPKRRKFKFLRGEDGKPEGLEEL